MNDREQELLVEVQHALGNYLDLFANHNSVDYWHAMAKVLTTLFDVTEPIERKGAGWERTN